MEQPQRNEPATARRCPICDALLAHSTMGTRSHLSKHLRAKELTHEEYMKLSLKYCEFRRKKK